MDTTISTADLRTLLLCSIRYALGRCSYITFEIGEMLERYFPLFDKDQQLFFIKEIEEELVRHEQLGKDCGQKMDHKMWSDLAMTLRGMLK